MGNNDNKISPGVNELLTVIQAALEHDSRNTVTPVIGTLKVLLTPGLPLDSDCALLASVLADAVQLPA